MKKSFGTTKFGKEVVKKFGYMGHPEFDSLDWDLLEEIDRLGTTTVEEATSLVWSDKDGQRVSKGELQLAFRRLVKDKLVEEVG